MPPLRQRERQIILISFVVEMGDEEVEGVFEDGAVEVVDGEGGVVLVLYLG